MIPPVIMQVLATMALLCSMSLELIGALALCKAGVVRIG